MTTVDNVPGLTRPVPPATGDVLVNAIVNTIQGVGQRTPISSFEPNVEASIRVWGLLRDGEPRVVRTNGAARGIASRGLGLLLRDGRLLAGSPDETKRLEAAIARAIEERHAGRKAVTESLRLWNQDGPDSLGVLIRPLPL